MWDIIKIFSFRQFFSFLWIIIHAFGSDLISDLRPLNQKTKKLMKRYNTHVLVHMCYMNEYSQGCVPTKFSHK